jgi:integrase
MSIPSYGTGGARPSKLLGLKWGDANLRSGFISISKSRYMDEEGSPKTAGSERVIKLLESVVEVLKRIKPLHTTENDYVFLNQKGTHLTSTHGARVFGIGS